MFNFIEKLRNKLKNYHENWSNGSPKQKYQYTFGFAIFVTHLVGIRVLSDLKWNWKTPFGIFVGIDMISSAIYTIHHYFKLGQYLKSIECTCTIGALIVSLTMYWVSVGPCRRRSKIVVSFSGNHIYPKTKDTSKFNAVCDKSAGRLAKNSLTVVTLVLVLYVQVLFGPVYAYLVHGRMTTSLGTILPFAKDDSLQSFIINMIHQLLSATYALFGSLSIEVISCLANDTFDIIPELIDLNIEEMEYDIKTKGWNLNTKLQLRNILIQIQDLDRHIMEFIDLIYVKLFVGPYLLVSSISIGIFAQLILNFPSGFGLAIWCYFQLMVMCHMGQKVKKANETITRSLCNMNWYTFSTSSQKDVAYMMNRLQNGAVLTMGPLAEINYETAADFTKVIFNFTMILYRFAK